MNLVSSSWYFRQMSLFWRISSLLVVKCFLKVLHLYQSVESQMVTTFCFSKQGECYVDEWGEKNLVKNGGG